MYAIVRSITTDSNTLEPVLDKNNWLPGLYQDHPEILRQKAIVLNKIASTERILVESAFLFTVYDEVTESWGIVSSSANREIAFYIRNSDSDRLKRACERLVHNLSVANTREKPEHNAHFELFDKIEVMQSNNPDLFFVGEIMSADRFSLALKDKNIEAYVGIFAGMAANALIILDLPPIELTLFHGLTREWQEFLGSSLDRLAAAMIVTSSVSFLNVFLHWYNIRHKTIINWIT